MLVVVVLVTGVGTCVDEPVAVFEMAATLSMSDCVTVYEPVQVTLCPTASVPAVSGQVHVKDTEGIESDSEMPVSVVLPVFVNTTL